MKDVVIFEQLEKSVSGDVYTDELRRLQLSTDGSIFSVEPSAVVYPKTDDDVISTLQFAERYNLSVHSRGAGSGLCGSALGKGIILDFTKYMNNLSSLDIAGKTFTCEPGYRHGELESVIKDTGLFFPPAPSSGEYATFGGMYGTNAGGEYSVKYGNVADYITDADIVFANGYKTTLSEIAQTDVTKLPNNLKTIYQLIKKNSKLIAKSYPKIKCNVAGYELRGMIKNDKLHLHKLLGGSEGTLAVVTKLTFSLLNKPKYSSLIVAYFDNKITSAKASQIALKHDPAAIEIMDKTLLKLAVTYRKELQDKIPSDIDNLLMIEFESDNETLPVQYARAVMQEILDAGLTDKINIATSKSEIEQLSAVRKAAVPILYQLKGDKKILALVEDAAVPTAKLTSYFKGLYKIFNAHQVEFVSYGHIAKGLLHNRPLLDMKNSQDIKLLKILADEVYELVERLGGTISGEHGDGRLRSCYIPRQYKDIYKIFLDVKKALDPNHILNPDIKTRFDKNQMKKSLRYGTSYKAADSESSLLQWGEGFINEAEKCHGCSKCTTVTDATRMCPMFKALRDENAAPKAKANVLRALLSGKIESKMMYDKAFQSVINNCVNCGSCSIECPSKVNIPKLALEAKSRYAKMYGTPLNAKLVTNFELAGKIVKYFSGLVSAVMKPKFMRNFLQRTTGLESERVFIKFKSKTLHNLVKRVEGDGRKTVLYFAGCYASYIRPEISVATVNVLKQLGYKVITPKQTCCGIPHLSKGMAKGTEKQINKNLKYWGKYLDEADHIVSACSSCVLSLMNEWGYYSNRKELDVVKSKICIVTDLIAKDLDYKFINSRFKSKKGALTIAYHNSCHMKLLPKPNASIDILKKLDIVNATDMQSSCCGMAGSWGLLHTNYDTSLKISSRMINKLNRLNVEYGLTDCPTCAMQMSHLSNKIILHPIEVIEKCLED